MYEPSQTKVSFLDAEIITSPLTLSIRTSLAAAAVILSCCACNTTSPLDATILIPSVCANIRITSPAAPVNFLNALL